MTIKIIYQFFFYLIYEIFVFSCHEALYRMSISRNSHVIFSNLAVKHPICRSPLTTPSKRSASPALLDSSNVQPNQLWQALVVSVKRTTALSESGEMDAFVLPFDPYMSEQRELSRTEKWLHSAGLLLRQPQALSGVIYLFNGLTTGQRGTRHPAGSGPSEVQTQVRLSHLPE